MSFVLAAPEAMAAAATNLQSIGSALSAAHSAAAAPTTNLLAAAEDEVSTAIASLFGTHAREFQALSSQVTAFHDRFVQSLNLGAGSYLATEAASTSPLDALGVFSPWKMLTGRPLFGNGTDGAAGTGDAGGDGGWIAGNGGNGGSGAAGTGGLAGHDGGAGGSAGMLGSGGKGGAGGAGSGSANGGAGGKGGAGGTLYGTG